MGRGQKRSPRPTGTLKKAGHNKVNQSARIWLTHLLSMHLYLTPENI